MRIGELLHRGIAELSDAGIPDAVSDVSLLLEHSLNMTRAQIYLAFDKQADPASENRFLESLERRKLREPAAYILGECEFWSLPFRVSRDVLIPRPETEFLLDSAIQTVRNQGLPDGPLVDLCCGSGVIAVVLALELERRVIAVDLSWKALLIASENARRNGVGDRVDFMQSDLFASFVRKNRIAMVVSNPPYVSQIELQRDLEPEVSVYEPRLALDGGRDGLECIRRIRKELPDVLQDTGLLFMEIGATQGKAVHELFCHSDDPNFLFDSVGILADYAGRDRVCRAQFKKMTRK